jgi:hypothetical protein
MVIVERFMLNTISFQVLVLSCVRYLADSPKDGQLSFMPSFSC